MYQGEYPTVPGMVRPDAPLTVWSLIGGPLLVGNFRVPARLCRVLTLPPVPTFPRTCPTLRLHVEIVKTKTREHTQYAMSFLKSLDRFQTHQIAVSVMEYACLAPARCPLSKSPSLTQGLFSGRADGTHITCTDRSLNGLVVAAGDGFSRVRLYRHPCPSDCPPSALFHELRGHGAGGISRARFLKGGNVLVTVGDSDRCDMRGT